MPNSFRFILKNLLILTFVFSIFGCSSDEKKENTAETLFKAAQELDQDERYEEALRKYSDLKNKFPYSNLATDAELAIADIYFKQESYVEAQASYQIFRELHPKHGQIEYVIFRTGLSYYNQLPETIDRDLSQAHKAIAQFVDLEKNFPASKYLKEAQEKKTASLKMLAEKEIYIADFYLKKQSYLSALKRYEGLLKNYPGLGFDERAKEGILVSQRNIKND